MSAEKGRCTYGWSEVAFRRRHRAQAAPRDELTAAGKTGEEIAAELQVSSATLYNWRQAYGGMDTDAAKELKELREENTRLQRLG
jgi:putative transposase